MKNAISVFLLFFVFSASLIPKLDIEELAKLPNLISHYQKHNQTEEISFISFIYLHYNGSNDHADASEHAKLPFFNHEMPNLVFVLNAKFEIPRLIQNVNPPQYFLHTILYFFISEISLFQPPKAN